MKHLRITLVNILVLFVIDIWGGFYLLRSRDVTFELTYVEFDILATLFSLFFLLLLCMIVARVILEVHFRNQLTGNPKWIFTVSLLVLFFSAVTIAILKIQQYQIILPVFGNYSLMTLGNANYFALGIRTVFVLGGGVAITLLWISRLHEKKENQSESPRLVRILQDTFLVVATIVISVVILKSTFIFVYNTLFFKSLEQDKSKNGQLFETEDRDLLSIHQDDSGYLELYFLNESHSSSAGLGEPSKFCSPM